jgi:hypothetical protein
MDHCFAVVWRRSLELNPWIIKNSTSGWTGVRPLFVFAAAKSKEDALLLDRQVSMLNKEHPHGRTA